MSLNSEVTSHLKRHDLADFIAPQRNRTNMGRVSAYADVQRKLPCLEEEPCAPLNRSCRLQLSGPGMSPRQRDQLRAELDACRTRMTRLTQERAAIMANLADLIPAARDAGIPVTEIATRANVSRTTVYAQLRRQVGA